MKLQLGVYDIMYKDAKPSKDGTRGPTTTGDVAEILESNYHIMETFYELRKKEITEALAKVMVEAAETQTTADFRDVESNIKNKFHAYLQSGEWQVTSGVIVQAALDGKRSKFIGSKTSKKKGARPAFLDTGQYSNAFLAKVS